MPNDETVEMYYIIKWNAVAVFKCKDLKCAELYLHILSLHGIVIRTGRTHLYRLVENVNKINLHKMLWFF